MDISRDPYQCSPLSAAELTGRDSVWSICQCFSILVWWVASSYSHLILVSSCETLPPYLQAWVSPVGASAFVAPGYPSLFLSFPFFLGLGGRACFFCSSCPIRSFFGQHTCFAILSSYPIHSSLPSLAYRAQPGYAVLPPLSVCSLSVLCLSRVRACPRSSVRTQFFTFQGNSFVSLVPQGF